MNRIEYRGLKTSVESFCLDDKCCLMLAGEPLYTCDVETLTGISERKMTPVYKGEDEYLCDIITGTLYSKDGACMSSSHLRIVGLPKDERRKILKRDLSVKTVTI